MQQKFEDLLVWPTNLPKKDPPWADPAKNRQEVQRFKIMYLSILLWNWTHSDNDQPEKLKIGWRCWVLASYQVLDLIARSSCIEEIEMFQQIRGQDSHLCLAIGPQKNTNLVVDVEILLPAKFWWIPICGCREEVEYVSANQRPQRPSLFSY